MLTRTVGVPLVVATLLAVPVFAQAAVQSAGDSVAASTAPNEFLAHGVAGEWSATKFKGVRVYNNDHQRVGEIRDVLVDHDGKVDAVVIGVGGFLGLDEHDVAVRFDELSWAEPRTGQGAKATRA
jgi:hypothetical protein